jgi:hypothetical protein
MKANVKLLRDILLCIQLLKRSLSEEDLGEPHRTRVAFVVKKLEGIYDTLSGGEFLE